MLITRGARMIAACALYGAFLAGCSGGAALPNLPGSGNRPNPAGAAALAASPRPVSRPAAQAPSAAFDGQPIGTTFFTHNALARRLSTNPPLDPQSAAMVSAVTVGDVGQLMFTTSGGAGTVVSTGHASDPLYTVHCLEPWGTCSATTVHVPDGTHAGAATDFHNAFIDVASGTETDSWLTCASYQGQGQFGAGYYGSACTFPLATRTLNIGWGGSGPLSADGTGFGGTASKLSLVSGIVRPEDLLAGQMTHGVEIAVQCAQKGTQVYPAEATDGLGSQTCTGASAEPRDGQILWLDGTGEAKLLALNPAVLAPYIRAMHDFGFYIGDRNESGSVPQGRDDFAPNIESDPAWLDVVSAIQSDPKAVDTSISQGSYHIVTRVPDDMRSYLHVLDVSCSQNGC